LSRVGKRRGREGKKERDRERKREREEKDDSFGQLLVTELPKKEH
jgi:hypothetical protein